MQEAGYALSCWASLRLTPSCRLHSSRIAPGLIRATGAVSGVRRQASGVRRQASGVRRQASGVLACCVAALEVAPRRVTEYRACAFLGSHIVIGRSVSVDRATQYRKNGRRAKPVFTIPPKISAFPATRFQYRDSLLPDTLLPDTLLPATRFQYRDSLLPATLLPNPSKTPQKIFAPKPETLSNVEKCP